MKNFAYAEINEQSFSNRTPVPLWDIFSTSVMIEIAYNISTCILLEMTHMYIEYIQSHHIKII